MIVTDGLERVRFQTGEASGLPNAFYTDEAVFRAESALLFADTWACIGFGRDVAQSGMATPVTFFGQPLVLLRDKQGVVRVFHNVCSHRGAVLLDKPARLTAALRCPYHAWSYDLEGKLRTTPHVGGAGKNRHPCIDRAKLGLREIRSHLFMDMVFVNLSGTAPSFADHARALTARWGEFTGQPLYHGGSESGFSLEVRANWKLAVENYCESYHLPFVHPELNRYSRLEDHYDIIEPEHFSGQGSRAYTPGLDDSGREFASFAGLSEKWDRAGEYVALYPNALLGVHKDHYFAMMLTPRSPDHTLERVEIYYAAPEMRDPAWRDLREKNSRQWKTVFMEDVGIVESLQRGRLAPSFKGGVFSPAMDAAPHDFHRWVAGRFLSARRVNGI